MKNNLLTNNINLFLFKIKKLLFFIFLSYTNMNLNELNRKKF